MEKYLNKEFLLNNKEKIIKVTAIIILVAVAFFVFILEDEGESQEQMMIDTQREAENVIDQENAGPAQETIIVDVAGAVHSPKVVELPADSRVADAIAAAGGLTEDADTSEVNQAAFLTDGEKIYIPENGESGDPGTGFSGNVSKDASKIDINTATSDELQTLKGIGPATAEKILAYRSDVGYFKSIEEIKNVDGIGEKTYENLKNDITV